MIDSIEDLDLPDPYGKERTVSEEDYWKQIDHTLQEKLGLSLNKLKEQVCESLKNRAEEVALDLPNIAPYGDYGAMLEDNDGMSSFLKNEASKLENWQLSKIKMDKNPNLIKFVLMCSAVDDGEVLMGLVFTNKSGEIRHSFCQVDV